MRDTHRPRSPCMEPLESRVLLSGACQLDDTSLAPTDDLAQVAEPALVRSAGRVAIPNIRGSYKGAITVGPNQVAFGRAKSTINITVQTRNGAISGVVTVSGVGISNIPVTGTIDSQGHFTSTYRGNGLSGKIKGNRAADGKLTGTFSGKARVDGVVVTISATFSYSKV